MRQVARTVALVVGVTIALPTTALAAAPSSDGAATGLHGIGIRLLDASVERRDDPRARLYIDDHLRPGTSITRHVQVSDYTAKPVHLKLFAVASSIDDAGWQVADDGTRNELTSWMRVTPSEVDLQPGRSATVTVDIEVPAGASKGERYATVVAEMPPPARSAGKTVRVATRVGVRVYLDVGPGGEPASDFTISTLTAARQPDGTPSVSAQVTNTGDRALDLGGRLTLGDGPGGLRAGPYDVQVPRTLGIGETGDVVVLLDKQTPAGPWLARMSLRSGYVRHAVTGTLSFPAAAGTAAAPVRAVPVPITKDRNVLVPLAIGLILALLLGLLLFLWRRRRRGDGDDSPAGGAVPSQRSAVAEDHLASR
jgi:hypothetical protein